MVEQQADPVVEALLEGIALVVAPPPLNPDEEVAVAIWQNEPSLRSTGIDNCSVLGAPCANSGRYIFGRSPGGEPLACVAFDGDGQWVRSMPLVGVRVIGSQCVDESSGVAQSPDACVSG